MEKIINKFPNANEITDKLIVKSAQNCIKNAIDGIIKIKELSKYCITKKDYLNFF